MTGLVTAAAHNSMIDLFARRSKVATRAIGIAQHGDNQERFGASFCQDGCQSHRNGSGDTLALGEAVVRELESRSDRSQRTPSEADYGEHAQG